MDQAIASSKKFIQFIHFNDVYNIEPSNDEPVGGAARFVTFIQHLKQQYPNAIVIFSGDLFAPSILSTLFGGKQMIMPINQMQVDVACYGNHDLDYSLEEINQLVKETNFPWLLSNVFDKELGKNLCNAESTHIIQKNDLKIGFIGLAEAEWLDLITEIDINRINYEDFVECGKRLSYELKYKQGCDVVVALTHMRVPNDRRLGQEVPDIDFIFGGHDHIIHLELVNHSLFIKSGSDFKDISLTTVEMENQNQIIADDSSKSLNQEKSFILKNKLYCQVNFYQITKQIEPNQSIEKHCEIYMQQCAKIMEKTIGYLEEDLDTRFCEIRAKETTIGNFIADVIRFSYSSQISLLNTGALRSDCIIQKGPFTYQMLFKIIPIADMIVVKEVPAQILIQALENGVSKYPAFEGRFLSVSGLKYKFDPTKPPGNRIIRDSIVLQDGQPLDMKQSYTVSMKNFIAQGKDGFDMLEKCKYIVDEENGSQFMDCVKDFFMSYQKHKMILRPLLFLMGQDNKTQIQHSPNKSNKLQEDKDVYEEQNQKSPETQKLHKEKRLTKFEFFKKSGLIYKTIIIDNQIYIVINPQIEGRVQIDTQNIDNN